MPTETPVSSPRNGLKLHVHKLPLAFEIVTAPPTPFDEGLVPPPLVPPALALQAAATSATVNRSPRILNRLMITPSPDLPTGPCLRY